MEGTGRWPRVERLYHAALERKAEERREFLESACQGDERLRREVESLLGYEGRANELSDGPAIETEARRLADDPGGSKASVPGLTPGTRLGAYEIHSLLGLGGMGEVHRARDAKLGRDVVSSAPTARRWQELFYLAFVNSLRNNLSRTHSTRSRQSSLEGSSRRSGDLRGQVAPPPDPACDPLTRITGVFVARPHSRAYTGLVMRWVLALLAAALLAPSAGAEVVVRVTDERVDVDATAAPLADVLDRLAGQTGMEIVYEGPRPRQRVTVTLQGRSPAEAVQGILEGQGLNYALVADPSGMKVQTLLLAGPVGKGTTPSSPALAPPRSRRPVMAPGARPDFMDPNLDEMEEEEPFEDPELDEPGFGDEFPPADAAPEAVAAPPPGAGVLPFPGGQPQVYPASPFTPQPFSVPPPDATPPAGPAQDAPPQ